jgi:hypothetical protein
MAHGKKHEFSHTHIEHHHDSSATVHHVHKDGAHKDVKHAVHNLDGIHDSMEDHLNQAGPSEQAADQGQHGVPAAQAAPAGLPMPGGMPGAGA